MATKLDVQLVLTGFLDCLLWSETDESGAPLDDNFDLQDLAEGVEAEFELDIKDFLESEGVQAMCEGLSSEQVGHAFCLTRNGHGTGFWDMGLGGNGLKLTEISKAWGTCNLYVSDSGLYKG